MRTTLNVWRDRRKRSRANEYLQGEGGKMEHVFLLWESSHGDRSSSANHLVVRYGVYRVWRKSDVYRNRFTWYSDIMWNDTEFRVNGEKFGDVMTLYTDEWRKERERGRGGSVRESGSVRERGECEEEGGVWERGEWERRGREKREEKKRKTKRKRERIF